LVPGAGFRAEALQKMRVLYPDCKQAGLFLWYRVEHHATGRRAALQRGAWQARYRAAWVAS
jgi:hypothetical protein